MKWIAILLACRNGVFGCHSRQGGNVFHKPLDSSFRWNDGKGDGYIPIILKKCPRHSKKRGFIFFSQQSLISVRTRTTDAGLICLTRLAPFAGRQKTEIFCMKLS